MDRTALFKEGIVLLYHSLAHSILYFGADILFRFKTRAAQRRVVSKIEAKVALIDSSVHSDLAIFPPFFFRGGGTSKYCC